MIQTLENYLRLLIAIEYSTNADKENVYGLYDTKNNDCLLMIADSFDDISALFKIKSNSIRSMFSRKQLLKNRFKIIKFKQEKFNLEDLLNLKDEDTLEDMLL